MRFLFRFIFFLCVFAFGLKLMRSPDVDAPRRPPVGFPTQDGAPAPRSDRSGPLLPPPSDDDPVVTIEGETRRGSSVGSAFALHESGVWMTARHVVDGCSVVALRGRQGWVLINVGWKHPHADMALLRTRGAPAHFALSGDRVAYNQDGYAFGYPQGRPGSVHGRLIGRTQMRSPDLYSGAAATLAWAEVAREPNTGGSLGGISGGPLLNSDASVVGVIVAEIPRRGRFETLAPEVLRAVSMNNELIPVSAEPATSVPVNAQDFGRVGDMLRRQLSVAQVGCSTE